MCTSARRLTSDAVAAVFLVTYSSLWFVHLGAAGITRRLYTLHCANVLDISHMQGRSTHAPPTVDMEPI